MNNSTEPQSLHYCLDYTPGTEEKSREYTLLTTANTPETALYGAWSSHFFSSPCTTFVHMFQRVRYSNCSF